MDHAITEIQGSSDDEIEEQETKRKRDLTSGTDAFGLIYYALPLKFWICKNRCIPKKKSHFAPVVFKSYKEVNAILTLLLGSWKRWIEMELVKIDWVLLLSKI